MFNPPVGGASCPSIDSVLFIPSDGTGSPGSDISIMLITPQIPGISWVVAVGTDDGAGGFTAPPTEMIQAVYPTPDNPTPVSTIADGRRVRVWLYNPGNAQRSANFYEKVFANG